MTTVQEELYDYLSENEEIEDLWEEHSQHKPPYWKLMKRCSECFKKHEEIINRSRTGGRDDGIWERQNELHQEEKSQNPFN